MNDRSKRGHSNRPGADQPSPDEKPVQTPQRSSYRFDWKQIAIAFGLFLLGYLTFNNPWQ